MSNDAVIHIQILAAKDDSGASAQAAAVACGRREDISDLARRHGAEALLVCPAPHLDGDRIDLIVAARFAGELDGDTVFWRQRALARDFHHALRTEVLVVDLDGPLGFLDHIAPMLASPYRDVAVAEERAAKRRRWDRADPRGRRL